MTGKIIKIRGMDFNITDFLGKGKSGYSYLIENNEKKYVLKKMHDEPCAYYQFGDKLQSELGAYHTLKHIGINIPELIEYNDYEKYLIKEYVHGKTAARLIAENDISQNIIKQIFDISKRAASNGINLDYFPTNFIVSDEGMLIYIDYELNNYMEEWNLVNWGIFYWLNSEGMKNYLQTGDLLNLNQDYHTGIPIKNPFLERVKKLTTKFS